MKIISIHKQNQSFSIEEANAIVKTLYTITHETKLSIDKLMTQLENAEDKQTFIETKINDIIVVWQNKLKALGAETKGLYLADLPSNNGTVFCWKYPEKKVMYQHKIGENFRGRTAI